MLPVPCCRRGILRDGEAKTFLESRGRQFFQGQSFRRGVMLLTRLRLSLSSIAMVAALSCNSYGADEIKGEISSEVSTGTSSADGTRKSKDSDWTKFTVPDGYVINKEKTHVE